MTDLITVTAGAQQADVDPGVYNVTLTDISEPRTIFPQSGPNAGKEVTLRDWTFSLDDGTEIRGSASTASGPKSKTFAWLTALLGGTPPAIGSSYPREQLIGREALATVIVDEGGWAKIQNLSALPRARAAAPIAPAAPVAAPAAPARQRAQPVAAAPRTVAGSPVLPVPDAGLDDLPF